MKLPRIPKPARKPKASAARRQVRVPRPLDDLYRDMRDRRLILPAVALLVAIIAVPVALSADKESPPAPLAYTPPEGAEAVAPAVLTEQPVGVRDYRERLDELKSKNPFASDFGGPAEGGSGGGSSAAASSPTVDVTAPTGSGSGGPTTTNTDTIQPDNPTGDAATEQPDDSQSSGSGDGGGDEVLILAPRIDVRGGPVGNRKKIKDVESGDLLPDRAGPDRDVPRRQREPQVRALRGLRRTSPKPRATASADRTVATASSSS